MHLFNGKTMHDELIDLIAYRVDNHYSFVYKIAFLLASLLFRQKRNEKCQQKRRAKIVPTCFPGSLAIVKKIISCYAPETWSSFPLPMQFTKERDRFTEKTRFKPKTYLHGKHEVFFEEFC